MLVFTNVRGSWRLGMAALALMPMSVGCTGDAFFSDDGSGGAATGGSGAQASGGNGGAGAGQSSGGDGTGGLGDPCDGGGVCVPEAPAGWLGPVAIVESGAGPVPCSGDFPNKQQSLVDEPTGHAAECSPCACNAPNNQDCQFGSGQSFTNANCTGSASVIAALDNGCSSAAGTGGFGAVQYPNGSLTQAGSCAPQGGGVSNLPPGFNTNVTLCSVAGAAPACGMNGNVCLPVPDMPFAQNFCIYQPGEQDCPEQIYRRQSQFSVGQDSRACSECGCGTPSGPCVATIGVFTSPTCDDGMVASGSTGSCIDASITSGGITVLEMQPVACPAYGGEPTGAATEGEIVTVCCINNG